MLNCQKDKFTLPEEVSYFNNAYMSPILKSTQLVGLEAVMKKSNPTLYTESDFFSSVKILKESFVVVAEQFPSNYYPWQEYAKKHAQNIKVIAVDRNKTDWVSDWNKAIIESIGPATTAVALGHVHWADGTLFDLKRIRELTKLHGAALVIDGSQSIGALPLYINEIEVDALITVGYKWLLGHYGLGLAYYSSTFNDGVPIEDNWMNKKDSHVFQNLVNYTDTYREGAARYSMGAQSNFILVAMLQDSLSQINVGGVENIQAYCKELHQAMYDQLQNSKLIINQPGENTASHLVGVRLKENTGVDIDDIKKLLLNNNIHVSYRGDAMRISLHLHNDKKQISNLCNLLARL